MSTPWEVVVKMYRNQLNNKSFGTVSDYQADFINYLKSKNYFSTIVGITRSLNSSYYKIFNHFLSISIQITSNQNADYANITDNERATRILPNLKSILQENINTLKTSPNHLGGFDMWTDGEIRNIIDTIAPVEIAINNYSRLADIVRGDVVTIQLFSEYIKSYLKSGDFRLSNSSGLVFIGFGEDEIYPHCTCSELAEVLDDKIRWKIASDIVINEDQSSAIQAFAQGDDISNIIDGIHPTYASQFYDQIGLLLSNYNKTLANLVSSVDPGLASQIISIDTQPLVQNLMQQMTAFQSHFSTNPTINAVRLFSKEDLAELAESLIYLTYLKKRMTFTDETVSKPVDVAIISKGDGFVWIKRKFYFEQDLNPHFLRNHYKE